MSADVRISPSTPEDVVPLVQIRHFQAMVGCLIYLEQGTRFDLAFAIAQLTRVMGAPNLSHEWVMPNTCIDIWPEQEISALLMVHHTVLSHRRRWAVLITLYPHTSMLMPVWVASTRKERVLHAGVIVCHFGSPIMWTSHLQSVVALSTMESEMMATSTAWYTTHLVREKCIC